MKLARLLLWATAPLAVSTLRHSSQRGVSRRDVPVPNGANVTSAKAVLGAISDQDWKKLRDKGCTLLQAMSASDEEAAAFFPGLEGSAESQYQNYPDDMKTWGYTEKPVLDFETMTPPYEKYFKHLGLNPAKDLEGKPGPNKAVYFNHDTETKHNDVVYKPTGAIFKTIVNVQDGAMVAWIKFGPRHSSAGKNIPVLPKLQAWSDAAFLSWKSRGGGANLRYVFSMSIMNQQFPFIIGRALHEVKKRKDASDFSEYDECSKFLWGNRAEFNLDTDAGKALLGSPNGRGVGYLLAQHKSTFGAKGTVNKVTFFCSGGQGEGGNFEEMHLLFHVIPDLGGSENKRPNEEEHEKPPPPTEGVP